MVGEIAMADKTFGVKVSEKLHDRVKDMIEISGMSSKDWFEKAVALTEMQSIKQGATEYNQDLSELEIHTTRIYELITNMIQRSIYIKDSAVKEVSDKLEQKEAIIGEYQEKANNAIEQLKESQELVKVLETEKEELSKQLDQALSTNENNQLLINEYKEKNDTLSGLVTQYKGYAEENEQLKQEHAAVVERLRSAINELKTQNEYQLDEIKELKQTNESLKDKHAVELERLTEKMDYEKNKALLELEREYQQKLLSANEEYTKRIQQLYDEINATRKEYEAKIEQLNLESAAQKKQNTNKNKQQLTKSRNEYFIMALLFFIKKCENALFDDQTSDFFAQTSTFDD